jgi:FkbM family methyltransferase
MSSVNKNLIYDLGMHNGQDTDFYLAKGFKVIAVEANPDLCAGARERFANQLESGQLIIEEIAISDTIGEATFYLNQTNTKWSSLFDVWGERGKGAVLTTVKTDLFENLLSKHGIPYYLKIDIEGADAIALQALHKMKEKPNFVSVEGGGPVMLDIMKALGYSKFAVVNQANVEKIDCPKPAREGEYVDHNFEMGASGLFGEEILEPWITYDEVMEERVRFKQVIADISKKHPNSPSQQRNARAHLGWFDVHARL